jgi:hypothetical protein
MIDPASVPSVAADELLGRYVLFSKGEKGGSGEKGSELLNKSF